MHWRLAGPLSVDDLRVVFDVWTVMVRKYSWIYTLLEVCESISVSAESRRYIAERSRGERDHGSTVVVGASAVFRVVVQLMHNGFRLLGFTLAVPQFCATIEEAELWLTRERSRHVELQPPL